VELPPEGDLAAFLSEAYQASLLREENRAVNCRLILIHPTELSDNTGPPATLLTGKLQGHGFRIFEASWLVRRQEQFARWASRECFRDQAAPALVNVDFTRALGEN